MSAIDKEPFPRGALIATGALVGLVLVLTAAGRLEHVMGPAAPAASAEAAPTKSVDLRFLDQTDGSVSVRDSHTGAVVATLAPGTNGFIRGVLRGLARERRGLHIGSEPAFRLMAWSDGRIALDDTATGRRIDLGAFGGTNKAAFVSLLEGTAS